MGFLLLFSIIISFGDLVRYRSNERPSRMGLCFRGSPIKRRLYWGLVTGSNPVISSKVKLHRFSSMGFLLLFSIIISFGDHVLYRSNERPSRMGLCFRGSPIKRRLYWGLVTGSNPVISSKKSLVTFVSRFFLSNSLADLIIIRPQSVIKRALRVYAKRIR